MIQKTCIRHLNFSQDFLYDLVRDVASYPRFVPGCEKVSVFGEGDGDSFYVDVTVCAGPLRDTYRCLVTFPGNHQIVSTLVPLSYGFLASLTSVWVFDRVNSFTTRVEYSISFRLKSLLMNQLMRAHMDKLVHKMMEAFEQRAQALTAILEKR